LSKKKIFLIRHGQTDFNLKGIVQGSGVNTDINETGRKQAEAFFEKYKDVPFQKIYTSNLKRTIQSVQKFIDKGIVAEAYEGLNEISWGDKDGKIVTSKDASVYWDMIAEWNKGNVEERIQGGESPLEVQKRIRGVLEIILSREEEEHILICMHGRAMRIFLTTVLNYELKCMDQFDHHNLGLYELTYTGSLFTVDKFNDLEHLNGIN
jgi:broad specificity phosphatase PhoE